MFRSPLHLLVPFFALAVLSCSDAATDPDGSAPGQPSSELATSTSDHWIRRANLPSIERYGPAVAVVPNAAGESILYVIGGETATGASLSKVQAYNVAADTWTYRASVPTPLYFTNGAAVLGGKIYISGGFSGNKAFSLSLFVYDPVRNTWSRKHDMPRTSFSGATGMINNRLYVLTSCTMEECDMYETRAFYRYDPGTDTWTSLPLPPQEVIGRIAGVISGKLYTVGGSQIGVYDPVAQKWSVRTPTRDMLPVSGATVVMLGGVYMVGQAVRNADGTVTPGMVKVYDPATNAWSRKASMPLPRYRFGAARVFLNGAPRIEVVGGTRAGSNLQYIP